MTRIEFDTEVPKEVESAIRPTMEKWLWLLPTWVHVVFVMFSNDDQASLSTSCDEEYRKVRMWVHPNWLIQSAEVRDRHVCHEYIHVLTDPLYQFGKRLIGTLEKDSQARKWADEDLRLGVERSTCDLAYAIRKGEAKQ